MSEFFRIDVENQTGDTILTLKSWQYFSYEQRVARRGSFRLQLHDNEPLAKLIKSDYILRYWYKNLQYGIDWINPFNGILKTPTRVWYGNGNKLNIWYGSDSNELIDKSLVMYPTSSTKAEKTGVATDVMAEYIEENIGASATVANGRFIDHVNPITVVAPSPGIGPVWTGNSAHEVLVKTLQEVRNYTLEQEDRIDFEVRYAGNYQWEVHVGKLFEDKTINGLSTTTGLNSAGNVPIILSPLYKNVEQYTESVQRVQESNVILVLGQRIGNDREFTIATDTNSLAASPIAQRESMAQTQNQQNLTDVAAAELEARVGKLKVLVEPRFTESFSLYRDLNIGDFFTIVSLDGEAFNKQFIELKVQVQQTLGGRTISQYTIFTEDREP